MGKSRLTAMIEQKPEDKIRDPRDPNRVFVKVNSHPALAVIDLQATGGDLISTQFVYLLNLWLVMIESTTTANPMKWYKANVA